ncbi:DMT family transporter [Pseudonocardia sp. S2-4]|uniref:DMT family transporter n=1 Tax=Pseudonocardia humida TaxID=2800819 RepID=A0ABT0ZXY1_9PSEU|nr:DMT family transporter [Pseudonocardia humida]
MGAVLCLVSAACFGAMAIFGKLAYEAGVPTGTLLLVRFALAAVLLVALLVLRPGLRSGAATGARSARPTTGLLVTALGMGAVGYATQSSLYFSALEVMDASLLALIFYTYPLLVTLGAVALGRDRLTARRAAALVAASGGTLLVLAGAGAQQIDPIGALMAFGTALAYTVYILVADTVVGRLAPVPLAALVMSGAALTLTARALATGGVELGFGLRGWFWLVCIAVVSTVVAMLTFFAGLRRIGPSSAAILSTFEPVVTTALAALALGEFLTPVQLAGGLLVLSCVVVVQGVRRHPAGSGRHQRGEDVAGAGPQQRPALVGQQVQASAREAPGEGAAVVG